MDDLETSILELLAKGPSSFAALYGYLLRNNLTSQDIGAAFDRLLDMERRGLVAMRATDDRGKLERANEAFLERARTQYGEWLANLGATQLSPRAMSLDEVGLWFAPGPAGQEAIASWLQEQGPGEMWELAATPDSITIRSASEAIAMRELNAWLLHHPDRTIDPASRTQEPLKRVALRSGGTLEDGVQISVTLHKASPTR
ncbi:MAG: hypothetical protein ACFCGT_26870 [Sandaracinaceae bacterium]